MTAAELKERAGALAKKAEARLADLKRAVASPQELADATDLAAILRAVAGGDVVTECRRVGEDDLCAESLVIQGQGGGDG